MSWKEKLVNYVVSELEKDISWKDISKKILNNGNLGIHLAVFNEPFLSLVFSGEKKVESRFSINKISPYRRIDKGDLVIIKKSGGPVSGVFLSEEVEFYSNIDDHQLRNIENMYGKLICSYKDSNFWENRKLTKYASLIKIGKLRRIKPFQSEKKDRLGWTVIQNNLSNSLLDNTMEQKPIKTLIALCGRIASGKTTIANKISKETHIPTGSFGNYIREYCISRNLSTERENLQNIGENFVSTDAIGFLNDVIIHYRNESNSLILDGIRHKNIFNLLNQKKLNLVTIYVDCNKEVRYKRFCKQNQLTEDSNSLNQFNKANNHSVEREIEELKPLCSIVVDSVDYQHKILMQRIKDLSLI